MKMLRLLSYFLTGATATTFVGWALSFTPHFILLAVYVLAGFILAIGLALGFDDPIAEYFGLELGSYYTILGAIVACFVAGAIVLGGILWL